MDIRKTILALSVAVAAVPAAFADNVVGNEIQNYEPHPRTSNLTREQVQREYEAFRAHPVLSDGTVVVGGELGAVSANQGAFADREPRFPHTHVLGNSPGTVPMAAPMPMTEAERRVYREQYIN